VASFVGFVPVNQPALVVVATLDSPRGAYHGGEVAAPLFARVAEAALRRLAVPPDDGARRLRVVTGAVLKEASYRPGALAPPPAAVPGEPALMPDLRGLAARDAALGAARLGLIVRLSGSGRVVSQTPEPGAEVAAGSACTLVLTSEGEARTQGGGR
jgi:cell division protein FtsI (penicillin-binding protein 3)